MMKDILEDIYTSENLPWRRFLPLLLYFSLEVSGDSAGSCCVLQAVRKPKKQQRKATFLSENTIISHMLHSTTDHGSIDITKQQLIFLY